MSVQIARTTLQGNTNFAIALGKIFGIGRTSGLEIAEACGISKELKVKDVKEPYILKVEHYRGSRHEHGLSIKGRTHSNSQTAKKLKHVTMYDTSR
eukprot:gene19209-25827_t